ncbi:MAG: DNA mismatch repair protein MutS [Acidobacteria bacterium]|nr:MAG: DNA mismatch repair protein MutS [Acidobacteriota bacterium]
MNDFSTPLMRQYSSIKQRHPNALLLFRLGDFYELFFEDAIVAARELQITLTSRNKEKGVAIPMCGVPFHAAEGYIAKLIRKGFRVAICDQMEDPRLAKKLVKREVTRVVTPGTAIDPQVLEPRENNYLAAAAERDGAIGLAFADLSTGDFRATEFSGPESRARFEEELGRMRPSEALTPASGSAWPASGPGPTAGSEVSSARASHAVAAPASDGPGTIRGRPENSRVTETRLDDWVFSDDYGSRLLREHFRVATLAGYGLEGHPLAVAAAGAILHYVRETQRSSLSHFDGVRFYEQRDSLMLDPATLRNLELLEPVFGGDRASTLLAVLDQCATSLGARLLKNWILRPSLHRQEIEARLEAVEVLSRDVIAREEFRRVLGKVQDLERLLSKVTLETANARDLLALKQSIKHLPLIRKHVAHFPAPRLSELYEGLDELADVYERLEQSIHPEPPALLTEGGLIRRGYRADLDELRDLCQTSKQVIAGIEARERERTRIASLKVRFNQIFGYYIEVSKPNLSHVPADYERKQTMVNAERFTTAELKQLETRILEAEERSRTLELELFREVRRQVAAEARRIRQTAQALAELDVLACFAHVAAERNYRRPEFSDDGELLIVQGRHPVIERISEQDPSGRFVPNDLSMNSASDRILIITGPNMGGKSTYLRQAALIALMAQMGSFVPAERARLPILDRIFTRIGASDNLARGRSTFMVEMTEAATILNTATPRSLVLLDEVGRGTATFDGLSIAWAVVEYLQRHTQAKTLFATHYHELTELADLLPGVRNYHVSVKESGSTIVFLRKVEPGSADKSYGIEVARLAGLPSTVIDRAREILERHEQSEHSLSGRLASHPASEQPGPVQLTIFTPLNADIIRALEQADLNNTKPIEALNLLAELKKQIQS